MHPTTRLARVVAGLILAWAAGATLTACSSSGEPAAASGAGALTITDPWVKAADSGMTAAFGTLANPSDQDVRIVSATTSISTVELHETATGDDGATVMRPKDGGFVVPAGGELALGPGGDHLMLMDLTAPIAPGDDVEIALTAQDGTTFTFTASARSFSGANESYDGEGTSGGTDMDDGGEGGGSMAPPTAGPAS